MVVRLRDLEEHYQGQICIWQYQTTWLIKVYVSLATDLIYLGHRIKSEGLKPDPSKIKAIVKMPNPHNKEELQRFLDMSNYLCRLIPKYSKITAPLRTLLQNDVGWTFDQPQQKVIDNLKDLLTNQSLLQFYSPSQQIQVNLISEPSLTKRVREVDSL